MRQPLFAVTAQNPCADNVIRHQVPVAADARVGDRIMRFLVAEKGDRNERRLGLPADTLVERRQNVLAKLRGHFRDSFGLGALAYFIQDRDQVAQRRPAFGVGIERINRRRDVTAVLFLRKQSVLVGAAGLDARGFLFPTGAHGLDEHGIARLPIIAADVLQLVAGLVELQALAREVEQRRGQGAAVRLRHPPPPRPYRITALGFVTLVVFVPGAVTHAVAVDQLKILYQQMPPGVVYERLRRLHLHAPRQHLVPTLYAFRALVVVIPGRRKGRKEFLTCLADSCLLFPVSLLLPRAPQRLRYYRQCGDLVRPNFGVCSLTLPRPVLVKVRQHMTLIIAHNAVGELDGRLRIELHGYEV